MTSFSLTQARDEKLRAFYFDKVNEYREQYWDGQGK